MKAPGLLGGPVVTGLVGGMAQMLGAPWQAVLAIAIVGLLITLILGLAQLAMPQESQDKRLLWEKFIDYRRERLHITAPMKKSRRPRRAVRAAPEQKAPVVALPRSPASSERTTARSP
jgi:hypothetical protein